MSSFFWNKYFGNKSLKPLMVIYIGDSITFGANHFDPKSTAPPVIASKYLQDNLKNTKVYFANCGVGGATTIDFLPEQRYLFTNVIKEAEKFLHFENRPEQLLFSILLGTNDSASKGINGAPLLPNQYRLNVSLIINQLLKLYPNCKVFLHKPIWFSNNTYNGAMYLQDALDRLVSYFPEIDSLIDEYSITNPNHVFLGDADGFSYFKNNYLTDHTHEKGNAGTYFLHPNKKGAAKLGELWGKAILKVIAN